MLDPINGFRASLEVLSRSEIERAWAAAEAVSKALDGNMAMRAELAAYVLASIIDEIGRATKQQDDLADVLPAVDALATYVCGRMAVIVSDLGNADAA